MNCNGAVIARVVFVSYFGVSLFIQLCILYEGTDFPIDEYNEDSRGVALLAEFCTFPAGILVHFMIYRPMIAVLGFADFLYAKSECGWHVFSGLHMLAFFLQSAVLWKLIFAPR